MDVKILPRLFYHVPDSQSSFPFFLLYPISCYHFACHRPSRICPYIHEHNSCFLAPLLFLDFALMYPSTTNLSKFESDSNDSEHTGPVCPSHLPNVTVAYVDGITIIALTPSNDGLRLVLVRGIAVWAPINHGSMYPHERRTAAQLLQHSKLDFSIYTHVHHDIVNRLSQISSADSHLKRNSHSSHQLYITWYPQARNACLAVNLTVPT